MDTVLYTVLAFGAGALAVYMFYVLWNFTDTFGRIIAFLGASGIEFWIVTHTIELFGILLVFLMAYVFSLAYIMYAAERG